MNAHISRTSRGFTLIELMVVVTIIAILAALIVPALNSVVARTAGIRCLSQARSIAASLRTYAANWKGWTNPDADYFVKEFGHKLSSEEGYYGEPAGTWSADTSSRSYQRALETREFVCSVDPSPPRTRHVVPSSYAVTTFFAGMNVMTLDLEANRVLAVREVGGKRHPVPGDRMERSYVFADLSATLGYDGPVFPGATLRCWNRSSEAGIFNVAEDALPAADYESIHAGSTSLDHYWAYMLQGRLDVTRSYPNDWNNANIRDNRWYDYEIYGLLNVVARMDGFLKFPRDGNWEILARGYYPLYRVSFGVSTESGSPTDVADASSFTWSTKSASQWNDTTWRRIPLTDHEGYRRFQYVYRSYPDRQSYWHVSWRCQDADTGQWDPDYGGSSGQTIPASALFRLP